MEADPVADQVIASIFAGSYPRRSTIGGLDLGSHSRGKVPKEQFDRINVRDRSPNSSNLARCRFEFGS
jgi:hypothetical protein